MTERLRALHTLLAWARGEHRCPRCHGTGELFYPDRTDPQCDVYEDCPECDRTGEVRLTAIEAHAECEDAARADDRDRELDS